MAKSYKSYGDYNSKYHINYMKRILESYKIMQEAGLNYKVVKIKVPYYDLYERVGQPGEVVHDIPIYAVLEGTTEKTNGVDGGTCYDESIAYALLNFKNMPATAITCFIKVSIPLYNMLNKNGLILD